MRNTLSWSCTACGEYNVADLQDRPASLLRCRFCFRPVHTNPPLEPAARTRLSDEWLGDELIRPLFGAEADGESR
jgi:hypothetical protein